MNGNEWTVLLAVVAALEVTVLVPLVAILHYRLAAELKEERRETSEDRRELRQILMQIRDDTRVTERLALDNNRTLRRLEPPGAPPESDPPAGGE